MRIDKVYEGTYALPFAGDRKKAMCGRIDRKHILLLSRFWKISEEKTPWEKLPLHTNGSFYRRECNGGKSASGGQSGSEQNRDPRIPNAGDPGGQRPVEDGGRRHLR